VVVDPGSEICVFSNKHARILNTVCEVIPNHSCVHHRWCTRHLAQNLVKHDGIKENFKLFEEVCRQTEESYDVPFLDEEQWEPYDGSRYMADKAMMWKKRGPRRRARYAMEMD
jgi:hypothetical protein